MILKATTDEQILATREVMRQLRPHVSSEEYLASVKRMRQTDGYQLTALYDNDEVRAVAGYRFMEMFFSGKILYVDDLNTDERYRSKGYGKALLDWLKGRPGRIPAGSCISIQECRESRPTAFIFAKD